MKDLTFLIPIKIDSNDRLENLTTIVSYLQRCFKDCDIVIIEMDASPKLLYKSILADVKYRFITNDSPYFNKCKAINAGVKIVKTPYFAVYDADVFFNPEAIRIGLNVLKTENVQLIYPYNGNFYNIKRDIIGKLNSATNFDIDMKDCNLVHPQSVGGCFITSVECFKEVGGANEHFVSWGFEDNEIPIRYQKLGYNYAHLKEFVCFHIEHCSSDNSGINLLYKNNAFEIEKSKQMDANELRAYISTWRYFE